MAKSSAKSSRAVRFVPTLMALYLGFCLVQRLFYSVWITIDSGQIPPRMVAALGKGLLFDLAAAFFLFIPLLACMAVLPVNALRERNMRVLLVTFAFVPLATALLTFIGEITFFEEFKARFNFIAVDYLVYTHEVIKNIWESYPVGWAALGVSAFFVPVVLWLRLWVRRLEYQHGWFARRWVAAIIAVTMAAAATADEERLLAAEPYWTRELGKNTLFALFSAYRRNSIAFHEFYTSLDSKTASDLTDKWLDTPSLVRQVVPHHSEQRWNVVLVIIESMSARFLKHYGNKKDITPNLDALAERGLFLNRMYATGTRTVRGLEALMLSLPPTPGQSILRRPGSDGIFNLGTVFSNHGYRTQFVYGGYSYFDNMKEWFSTNGFEIHDRGTFDSGAIHFANAWGVCDEDLFDQVLQLADQSHAEGRPFFQAVLTTSNHRPYTFPEGRIDIPSKSGREGAVKYTDYAIGRFVKMAESKPWFKNTLFVFAADHNAAVAGGTDIPVADYLIPVIFYNPDLVPARTIDHLSSQIDVAPTLLGMLGFSYESRFFGQDLQSASAERALLGTYQKVAHLTPGKMVVLAPNHMVETQYLDESFKVIRSESVRARTGEGLSPEIQQTISLYQAASEFFTSGRAKVQAAIR